MLAAALIGCLPTPAPLDDPAFTDGQGGEGGALASTTGASTTAGSGSTDSTGGVEADPGWVFYVSARSGVAEIYASRDDETETVRMSEGLGDALTERALDSIEVSPDGRRLAYSILRDENGPSENMHIWVMETDGSDPRWVADIGVHTFNGIAWRADSTRLLFGHFVECDEDILQIDVSDPDATPELFVDVSNRAVTWPSVGGGRLVYRVQSCGEPAPPFDFGAMDLTNGMTGFLPIDNDYSQSSVGPAISESGELVVYHDTEQQTIHVFDVTTEDTWQIYGEVTARLTRPRFGNGDRNVYAVECAVDVCSVLVVDVAERAKLRTLDVLAVDATRVVWARLDESPDANGDGVADGV